MSSEKLKKPRKYFLYRGEKLTVNKIAEIIGVNNQRLHRKLKEVELETDITQLVDAFAKEPVQIGGKREGAGNFGKAGKTEVMRIPVAYKKLVEEFLEHLHETREQDETITSVRGRNAKDELIDVQIRSTKVRRKP